MKNDKKIIENNKAISILIMVVAILSNMVLWSIVMDKNLLETSTYVYAIEPEIVQDKIEQLDLTEIINKNTADIITEEILVEEEDIEYKTVYMNNSELAKGSIQVLQEGRDGKQNIITKRTYCNGELIKESNNTQISLSATERIVQIGTAKYKSNYKIKVGDDLYVTAETASVRMEPNSDSTKIRTIKHEDKVKVLEIKDNWYYISYNTSKGWIQSDCLTYIDPNANKYDEAAGTYTKSQLLAKLSKNMSLNKASGLSLEQFKKVLLNNKQDKNSILSNNAEYFYYAEKQYNINGVFLAAVAIHESNWGTSKIAIEKNNLFGYGASDSNPYNNAKIFSTYSEGIDLVARVFVKYYLNPAGTDIYNGEKANGRYYNGTTLSAVNKKYASDSNWTNNVYKWMSYLYNRL